MSSKTLKAARMSQHMTQQALADATGISRVNIAKAESGAINPEHMTAHYMDDRFRELVDWELAPCTELEFLTRYLEIAPYDLVIG